MMDKDVGILDMMDKGVGILGVETVEEHEDGSATYKFHMDANTRGLLAEEGLKLVLYCAAANLDMQEVFDWIESKMELTEYKIDEVRSDD